MSCGCQRSLIVSWFIFSICLSSLFLALILFIEYYHGGPIPTEKHVNAFTRIYWTHPLSIASCILAIILVSSPASSLQFSFYPCQLSCGLFLLLLVYTSQFLVFFQHFTTAYDFGEVELNPGQMSAYTQAHIQTHGEPPPFLTYYEKQFKGSCCGALGPHDYIPISSEQRNLNYLTFLDVPSSCCFPEKRKNSGNCGQHLWSPLLQILNNSLPATITRVDGGKDRRKKSKFFRTIFLEEASRTTKVQFEIDRPMLGWELFVNFKFVMPQKYREIVGLAQGLPWEEQEGFIKEKARQEVNRFLEEQKKNVDDLDQFLPFIPYVNPFL